MTQVSRLVVVAEDEVLIRMVAVEALVGAGFDVIEANHAGEALMVLTNQADRICVLFTDIHMPGDMDGLALAHHACVHWPWVALLIASGQALPLAAELPHGSRFLSKPYDPHHVVAHVRELAKA